MVMGHIGTGRGWVDQTASAAYGVQLYLRTRKFISLPRHRLYVWLPDGAGGA